MAINSKRRAISHMVYGALPPHSTNVLWMDTSVPELPVCKIFWNGCWTSVHTDDSKEIALLAKVVEELSSTTQSQENTIAQLSEQILAAIQAIDLSGVATEANATTNKEAILTAVSNLQTALQGSDSTATLTALKEAIALLPTVSAIQNGLAKETSVKDGNDTAISIGKEVRSEIGTPAIGQAATLFGAIGDVALNAQTLQSLADSWAAEVTNRQTLQGYTFANGTEANTISDILAKRTSLKEIYDTNITLITADNTFAGIATMKKINLPNLQLISSSASNCFVNNRYMEELIIPNCTNISGIKTFCTNDNNLRILDMTNYKESLNDSQQLDGCVNLIDLIIGRGEMNSFSLGGWSPTNALNASSQTLLTPEDIAAGFTSNLQKLLYNIREHIAANLPVAPNTITFSAAVKAAINADASTAAAFTNKNWTIA